MRCAASYIGTAVQTLAGGDEASSVTLTDWPTKQVFAWPTIFPNLASESIAGYGDEKSRIKIVHDVTTLNSSYSAQQPRRHIATWGKGREKEREGAREGRKER